MIPIEKGELLTAVKSYPESKGAANQDRFRLQAFQVREDSQEQATFAVLADGLGDQRAGEVAAELAVDIIFNRVAQSEGSQPTGILEAAVLRAGQAILAQSEQDKDRRGMGCTALCAWVIGRKLYTASVGNSRLYLQRGSQLIQLNVISEMHWAEDAEDEESAEQTAGYLGARIREDVDLRLTIDRDRSERATRNQGFPLRNNDRLLLCSDGLSDALDDEQIAELLGTSPIDEAADALVQAALATGSQDNMTALVLAVPPGRPAPARRRLALRRAAILVLSSLLLVLLSLTGWYFLGPLLDPSFTPEPTAINTLTPIP